MDDLMAMAAAKTYLSTERIVPTEELTAEGSFHTLRISRLMVDGVVEAPHGAHFTECPPDYGRDEAFQKEYAATASSPELWEAFVERYLSGDEADYQRAIEERA
jgi:glutaconate CoA-transferase subunit A